MRIMAAGQRRNDETREHQIDAIYPSGETVAAQLVMLGFIALSFWLARRQSVAVAAAR